MFFKIDKQLRNIIILSVGFALYLTGAQTTFNIQKTVTDSIEKEDPTFHANGYNSQIINYASVAFFNWAAPTVINVIGPTYSMALGTSCFCLFILQFLFANEWIMYLFSALIGFGSAIVWTSQGNYLTLNSSEKTITRNTAIVGLMQNSNMIIGNLFVMLAFEGKEHIDKGVRQVVLISLTVICAGGMILFMFLPKPRNDNKQTTQAQFNGPLQAFLAAVKLLFTPNMLLICLTCIYQGMGVGFFSSLYGSCVGFTKNLDNRKGLVGLCGILVGVGEVTGGTGFITLNNKIRRSKSVIIAIGCLIHLLCISLIFINLPNDSVFSDTDQKAIIQSSAIVAVFCAFILGLVDSIISNMTISLIGTVYAKNSAPAFSIYQSCLAMGSVIMFVTVQFQGLYVVLGILSGIGITGTLSYIKVERSVKQSVLSSTIVKEKSTNISVDLESQSEKY